MIKLRPELSWLEGFDLASLSLDDNQQMRLITKVDDLCSRLAEDIFQSFEQSNAFKDLDNCLKKMETIEKKNK